MWYIEPLGCDGNRLYSDSGSGSGSGSDGGLCECVQTTGVKSNP